MADTFRVGYRRNCLSYCLFSTLVDIPEFDIPAKTECEEFWWGLSSGLIREDLNYGNHKSRYEYTRETAESIIPHDRLSYWLKLGLLPVNP